MWSVAFSEVEGFDGGVKPGWISIYNRRFIPDLRANNVCRPAIQCRMSGRGFPDCSSKPAPTSNISIAGERQV